MGESYKSMVEAATEELAKGALIESSAKAYVHKTGRDLEKLYIVSADAVSNALSEVSEFFGSKLHAVKLDKENLTARAPFIAHLTKGHYILVTKITKSKIYFLDNHKEEFWPLDKFNQERHII